MNRRLVASRNSSELRRKEGVSMKESSRVVKEALGIQGIGGGTYIMLH